MNTIISSTQENSTVLLSFTSGIYDKIDISGVTTITGTSNSIMAILESDEFIGISSQSLIITDPDIENSTTSYFEGKGLTIIWLKYK